MLLIAVICGRVVAENSGFFASLQDPRVLLGVFLLHAGGFALGYALSKLVRMEEKAARTNSIEVGMQNSALGAMLATQHFGAMHPLAAVPCAISAVMHSCMGSLLAAYWYVILSVGRAMATGSSAAFRGILRHSAAFCGIPRHSAVFRGHHDLGPPSPRSSSSPSSFGPLRINSLTHSFWSVRRTAAFQGTSPRWTVTVISYCAS